MHRQAGRFERSFDVRHSSCKRTRLAERGPNDLESVGRHDAEAQKRDARQEPISAALVYDQFLDGDAALAGPRYGGSDACVSTAGLTVPVRA